MPICIIKRQQAFCYQTRWSEREQMHPYCLAHFPILLQFRGLFLESGATHNGLHLPTSTRNQDNPYRHAHRPPRSRKSPSQTLLLGDSRLLLSFPQPTVREWEHLPVSRSPCQGVQPLQGIREHTSISLLNVVLPLMRRALAPIQLVPRLCCPSS